MADKFFSNSIFLTYRVEPATPLDPTNNPDNGSVGGNLGVRLELQGDFRLTAGLKPNVWSFRVAAVDFDRIVPLAAQPATLKFAFQASSGEDYKLEKVYLVDAEADEDSVARPVSDTLTGAPGPAAPQSYTIRLADFRQQFVKPRGGVLTQGLINPSNDGVGTKMCSHLMRLCVTAMGQVVNLPTQTLDVIDPPRDLQWNLAHAPTELEKLLSHTGHVAVPQANGTLRVFKLGDGPDVVPPAELQVTTGDGGERISRLLSKSTVIGDRRATTVVITSAPNPIVVREKLKGPSATTWEFVAQDPRNTDPKTQGVWLKLSEIPDLGDPAAAIKNDFEGFGSASGTPSPYADQLRRQVFKCLRLVRTRNDIPHTSGYLLNRYRRWTRNAAQSEVTIRDVTIDVTGPGIGKNKEGDWIYQAEKRSTPSGLYSGIVIQFPDLFGTIPQALSPLSGSLSLGYTAPADNSLLLTVGRELTREDTLGVEPAFYIAGYRVAAGDEGTIEQLSEDEAKTALTDPDTIHIERPDLRLFKENNEEVNRHVLDAQAKAIATPLLKGANAPAFRQSVIGFYKVELSGKVAELSIRQTPPMTSWLVNTWFRPGSEMLVAQNEKERAGGVQAYPKQAETLPQRINENAVGAASYFEPLAFQGPSASGGGSLVMVKVTGNLLRGGCYSAAIVSTFDRVNTSAAGSLRLTAQVGQPVEFVNVDEQEFDTHWLSASTFAVGRLAPATEQGQLAQVIGVSNGALADAGRTIADSSDETAEATNWTRTNKGHKGLQLTLQTRTVYKPGGDEVLYRYFRTFQFDSFGRAFSASKETRVSVDAPTDCNDEEGG